MPGLNVHMNIPQKIFFSEKLPDGPLLQVDRQALVQHVRLFSGEKVGGLAFDILHLPQGLVGLAESPQQCGDEAQQQPQDDPALPASVYFGQSIVDANLVNDINQCGDQPHQGKEHFSSRVQL